MVVVLYIQWQHNYILWKIFSILSVPKLANIVRRNLNMYTQVHTQQLENCKPELKLKMNTIKHRNVFSDTDIIVIQQENINKDQDLGKDWFL